MKIRMITWNMGTNKNTEAQWKQEINQMWLKIIDDTGDCDEHPLTLSSSSSTNKECFDVLIIALQEDWMGEYGKFAQSVGEILNATTATATATGKWKWQKVESKGPPNFLKKPFAVKLFVYYRENGPLEYATFDYESICFKKTLTFCTKATVGMSIYIPEKKTQLIIMGSHLPVSTKNVDMGYSKRSSAVQKSIEQVYKNLQKKFPNLRNVASLWGGDMNYRRNTPVTQSGQSVEEQLTYALQQDNIFRVGETGSAERFQEHIVSFPPTCKLKHCKKGECPVCRQETDKKDLSSDGFDINKFRESLTSVSGEWSESHNNDIDDDEDFSQEESQEESEELDKGTGCYDASRIPSNCDRILYFSKGDVQLIPKTYKSWSQSKAVQTSDHNLVWADFVLQ